MLQKIEELLQELNNCKTNNTISAEDFRLSYLSKKGKISLLFDDFKQVPAEEKKITGAKLNELKTFANSILTELQILEAEKSGDDPTIDFSLPSEPIQMGARHPLSITKRRIREIFSKIGFCEFEGPEIEDDAHVFTMLNFPLDHPARDMQDTFFIEKNPDILLRTHTSSVQVRIMEKHKPPIRALFPGRVFRNEAISARAHCMFHQVEGLYIDKNVSFADLKQTLLYFSKEMFGKDTQIRLRPSFFPFTEPSAEMDISCTLCHGKGCSICKYSGWVEILGCGMVDPNVLNNCNIDSSVYTGFAFGMGIERITMLKYQINDIRLFFENDIRFLKQFTAE